MLQISTIIVAQTEQAEVFPVSVLKMHVDLESEFVYEEMLKLNQQFPDIDNKDKFKRIQKIKDDYRLAKSKGEKDTIQYIDITVKIRTKNIKQLQKISLKFLNQNGQNITDYIYFVNQNGNVLENNNKIYKIKNGEAKITVRLQKIIAKNIKNCEVFGEYKKRKKKTGSRIYELKY